MTNSANSKRVGFWLGFGIFVMPYLFTWALLMPGYGRKARIMGFGWLALILVLVGIFGSMENRAKANAEMFCSRFAVGGNFEQAAAAAMSETSAYGGKNSKRPFKGEKGEDVLFVMYMGLPPFSRYVCKIEGTEGRITNVRYFHFD